MTAGEGKKMRLAVLTSGGDSAGMNAAVRAVVKAGIIK
jgi:6-phosphofructokinase 1